MTDARVDALQRQLDREIEADRRSGSHLWDRIEYLQEQLADHTGHPLGDIRALVDRAMELRHDGCHVNIRRRAIPPSILAYKKEHGLEAAKERFKEFFGDATSPECPEAQEP